jgi:hypothetical protein
MCDLAFSPPTEFTTKIRKQSFKNSTQDPKPIGCNVWRVFTNTGFGGLVVSMLASGTQDRGFEAVRFFGRKTPQHAFLRRGSKAVCPNSQISGMLKNPVIYVEVGITGQIDRPFLTLIPSFAVTVLSCRLVWSASGDDGRN